MSTSPTAPKTDLMFLLSWASHALATEQTVGLAELGITPRSYCVLYKALPGNLAQKQLAEMCGVDKTTMVVTIDQLEKAGLVQRKQSKTDRRTWLIHVTPAGQDMIAKASDIVTRIQDEVLSTLPPEQREALVKGLATLVDGRLSVLPQCDRPPRRRTTR